MEYGYSKLSVGYHNIFNYPLTKFDLDKWDTKLQNSKTQKLKIVQKNNFHFINGRQNIVKKRIQNEKYSQDKLKIAKRAASLISKIPTVEFVGVTGSLAMMNSGINSDIDLMIITKHGRLWTTRMISYLVTWLLGFKTRKPKSKFEKDRLCLNMWMDESDLVWDKKDRNIYTAHEIAQIVPLINKNKTYEKFLYLNRWILDYWPNSVKIRKINIENRNKLKFSKFKYLNFISDFGLRASNFIAFRMQYMYMYKKITREVVTPTRAIFHPNDWGKVVMAKLAS